MVSFVCSSCHPWSCRKWGWGRLFQGTVYPTCGFPRLHFPIPFFSPSPPTILLLIFSLPWREWRGAVSKGRCSSMGLTKWWPLWVTVVTERLSTTKKPGEQLESSKSHYPEIVCTRTHTHNNFVYMFSDFTIQICIMHYVVFENILLFLSFYKLLFYLAYRWSFKCQFKI